MCFEPFSLFMRSAARCDTVALQAHHSVHGMCISALCRSVFGAFCINILLHNERLLIVFLVHLIYHMFLAHYCAIHLKEISKFNTDIKKNCPGIRSISVSADTQNFWYRFWKSGIAPPLLRCSDWLFACFYVLLEWLLVKRAHPPRFDILGCFLCVFFAHFNVCQIKMSSLIS